MRQRTGILLALISTFVGCASVSAQSFSTQGLLGGVTSLLSPGGISQTVQTVTGTPGASLGGSSSAINAGSQLLAPGISSGANSQFASPINTVNPNFAPGFAASHMVSTFDATRISTADTHQLIAGVSGLRQAREPNINPIQRTEGIITRISGSPHFSRAVSNSLELRSGTLFVSVNHPAKDATINTPLGRVWVKHDADVMITISNGIMRVRNLDGLGDAVRAQVGNISNAASPVIAIAPGYELISGQHTLSPADLLPSDGVARRNPTLLNGALLGVAEFALPTLLRGNGILAQLRSTTGDLEERVSGRILKMAAIQNHVRGTVGFDIQTPAGISGELTADIQIPPEAPTTPPVSGEIPANSAPGLQSAPGTTNTQPENQLQIAALNQTSASLLPGTDTTRVKKTYEEQKELQAYGNNRLLRDRSADLRKSNFDLANASRVPSKTISSSPANQPQVQTTAIARTPSNRIGSNYGDATTIRTNKQPNPNLTVRTIVQRYPEAVMAALVVIAGLLGVSAYLAHTAWVKAQELKQTNAQLTSQIEERQLAEDTIRQLNSSLEAKLAELATVNQNLEMARDSALQASKLKSEFVANISHELRTPLSIVLGMNSMLLGSKLSNNQKQYAAQTQESARSLLSIVNDLLDFSKIEAGKVALEPIDFSPATIVAQVIDMLSGAAVEKNIHLTSKIDPGVPYTLKGDPGRLRQILLNIVGNAIKFTETGTASIDAQIDSQTPEKVNLSFTIKDTGIGIPQEAMSKLFQPFVQADGSTTRLFGGTGLGLSISKRLVDLMGGSITVDSELNKGSQFTVTIPFERSADTLTSKTETQATETNTAASTQNQQGTLAFAQAPVLVAEDSPALQLIIKSHLKKLGFAAQVVSNGQEAVEAATTGNYSAILMDWQMPLMDGIEATKAIRAFEQGKNHTPIIALTAHAMEGNKEECLTIGMDDYLTKPFTGAQLEGVLSKWATS